MPPIATTGTVQLNVRMERELRDAGTAALESKGLSPSEFVRALWKRAADRGPALDQVVRIARDATVSDHSESEHGAQEDPLGRGQLLYTECLRQLGIDSIDAASVPQDDYDSMIGDAIAAKWEDRGLAHG